MKAKLLFTVLFSLGFVAISNAQYNQRGQTHDAGRGSGSMRNENQYSYKSGRDGYGEQNNNRAYGNNEYREGRFNRRNYRENRWENRHDYFRGREHDRDRRFW